MADEQSELNSSHEKTEVKEDDSQSEENLSAEKEDKTEETADNSAKEEKKVTVDKKQVKEDTSKKAEKNENKDENSDDDSEDEDDEEELPPGLLELPLEVEGKREKKKVERLSSAMIRSPQDKKKVEIEEGSGTKLGDIPYVEHQLNLTKAIELKPLHKVLFYRLGANNEVKKNIKQFNGFTHGQDSKEHEKRVARLNKMVTAGQLKTICMILGLERSGTKQNLVDRVLEFLMKPEDRGLKVKVKVKKRSTSAGGKNKGTKKRKSKEKGKKGKVEKSDESSVRDSNEEEAIEEDGEDEEVLEEYEEEEESEEEAPKKKKVKTDSKKKTAKKSVKENGKKEKPAPKKPTVKKRPAVTEADSDSMSADSDDKPIGKMKKSPPSNEEIKGLVKRLLDGADLEKVTMKTVVKQVYAKYPSFDLSDRKDFIKDTVKKVIT